MAKTKKLGRPSKYLKKYDEMLLKHMSQGFSYESFAGSIGVCRDTLYEWESKHPNFSDTKKRAIDACLFHWEQMGMQILRGKGSPPVWIFSMKARFGWSDQPAPEKIDRDPIQIELVERVSKGK